MNERRRTRTYDWIHSSINVAIGILIVLVAEGLARLVSTEFWPLALVIPILVACLVLFEKVFNGLIDWEFPKETDSPRKFDSKGDTPIVRHLSLPIGIVVGLLFALLDWTDPVFW
ncbi:conserved membrane hypothetical protein [Roseovarius sp. EC-HK134]|uniref:hypothetical protein n=1 Tax=unclassified Roseovarius TaxID=2614913 RepID=UPI00125135A8|nr:MULTISPECIES: hypothetical protein [unclassified Roseovarius]VVT00605.1 conserved membrane hypothetical protein [Roseovarius sp. EC-HK134]VVT01534.1 conserved membrane hypothetical protein [Roseovarius sp. EC-SD190]